MKNEVISIVSDGTLCQVIRCRRRSVGLYVHPERGVFVRAPLGVSLERIRKFVESKADWIQKKRQHFQSAIRPVVKRKYTSGETFFFLGESLTLEVEASEWLTRVMREGDRLHVRILASSISPDHGERIRRAVILWYRKEAEKILASRVVFFADRMGIAVPRFSLGQAKTSWGMCNARGRLRFNWKIIVAPLEIVDYVVVHELSHLVHLNHSPKFWALVEKFVPDYKKRRGHLKAVGSMCLF